MTNQAAPGQTLAELGEFGLIAAITAGPVTTAGIGATDSAGAPDVLVGPGDDGAVLLSDGPVVCSIDCLIEGVHFKRSWSGPVEVGRKSVAVNVADIEAMGARATGVLVGFSAPGDLPAQWALDFAAGIRQECAAAGVSLLGGDVTRARDISIAVTALGTLSGSAVTRDGAQPGDVVAFCGRLGWAAAGWTVLGRGFRSPRAVVEAYQVPAVPYGQGRVAAAAGAHAMIDVSDGLVADLGHVAQASRVVIDLESSTFEIAEPLQAVAAATGSDPLNLVLTGGEDHALVGSFAPADVPSGWSVIGRVSALQEAGLVEPGVRVDGEIWTGDGGWEHYR